MNDHRPARLFSLEQRASVFSWVVVIVAFATIVIFDVNAIWLILTGAIAGVIYSLKKSGKKQIVEESQGEPLHEEEVDE